MKSIILSEPIMVRRKIVPSPPWLSLSHGGLGQRPRSMKIIFSWSGVIVIKIY
jgi:hypothetical protein